MIDMKRVIFTAIISLVVAGGCKNKPSMSNSDYMTFDEVVFQKNVPIVHLDNPERIEIDIMGGFDFRILDSLVIFSTNQANNLWAVFSMPDFKLIGNCLQMGNGPMELLQSPWTYQAVFSAEEGELFASFGDPSKGRLLKLNVSKSLKEGKTDLSIINESLPVDLMWCVPLNDSTLLCRGMDNNLTQQNRYLLQAGKKEVPESFQKLNRARVDIGEEFNILSTNVVYNQERKRLVEAPIMLNYINIYDINGKWGRTICTDKALFNIRDLQKMGRDNLKFTYGIVCGYDNMFGVYRHGAKDQPSILFFDFDGNPLTELVLDQQLTCFDVDFNTGHLYTYNLGTEDFYRYDIGDILKQMQTMVVDKKTKS